MSRRASLLALVAVLVRTAGALMVRVVDSDSARDLQMAGLIGQGRFADALRLPTPTPPLHPFLTALLDLPVGNLLFAGVAVSVLLGGLAVLPLYAMARRVWEERIATTAGLLYALLPAIVDLHVEAMTEGTFMFFFLGAMALGWKALEEQSWEQTVVTAACAALAWLSRPEGIYLLPLFVLASVLRFSRFSPLALGIFAVVWTVLAMPYLSFIHAETGHWRPTLSAIPTIYTDYFSGKGNPALALQDYSEYRAVARHGVLLGGGGHLLSNFFGKVLFYALGPFLLLGLVEPRPSTGQRPLLIYGWIAAAGYLIPIALSFVVSAPFSHRFLVVPAALLLPTVAAGLARAADRTRRKEALPLFVGALCLVMAVRDLRPRRTDKLGAKEAGLAVLEALGPGKRVYSSLRALEFYARSEHADEGVQADAVAFCMPELRDSDQPLLQSLERQARLLGEFPSPPRRGVLPVRVYIRKQPR
ncbi:MAG: glycosyltransferase family 39 protein [Planctomycetaceae bacterium]|nr:glycosyltransferase family 39 protein [Planctomycetaceae bacterium]